MSVAVFHAKSSGKIAVIPPKDLQSEYLVPEQGQERHKGSVKVLESRNHRNTQASGFQTVPGMFYHPEWDVTMSCHGDDFLVADGLDRLDEVMREGFEVKVRDWRSHLRRRNQFRRTLTPSDYLVGGWVHLASRPDVRKTPCQGSGPGRLQRSRHTCASKEIGKNSRDLDKALTEEKAKIFCKLAGTALYLSLDRPSI